MIRGRTELKNELANNLINNGANNINVFSGKINLKIEKGNSNDDPRRKMESKELSKNLKDSNVITKTINIGKKDKINKFKTNNNDVHKKLQLRREINKNNVKPRLLFDFPPKKIIIKTKNNNTHKQINLITNKLNSKYLLEESKKELEEVKNIEKKIKFDISDQIYNSSKDEKLDSYEINNLEYAMAIKIDHRKFFEIYWSILKREHSIIFTFFMRNDHNIIYIKYSRFIFFVCTDMALNVFFFSDDTMHKLYIDYGKYNFIQQIPQIIYSTIVSQMIQVFVCYLSLTDKHYYQIKNLNIKSPSLILDIVKCVHLKIIFFFIFTGVMFFFYWYTITSFCAVYENTQIAFIKDSIISFGLGLLYPFALYLIPSVLRIISLKYCVGKLSFVYKLSDIIPIF